MICLNMGASRRSVAIAAALASLLGYGPAQAQDPPPAAWRVECAGDGKTLECRALQSLVNGTWTTIDTGVQAYAVAGDSTLFDLETSGNLWT